MALDDWKPLMDLTPLLKRQKRFSNPVRFHIPMRKQSKSAIQNKRLLSLLL